MLALYIGAEMQRALDKIKLDRSTDVFKRYEIISRSGLIVNGSMAFIGGTGVGKTSLITKLVKIYGEHLKQMHVIYVGEPDQTFKTNYTGPVTVIKPDKLVQTLDTYVQLKKQLIDALVRIRDGFADEADVAFVHKHMSPDGMWPALVTREKPVFVVPTITIFDDITQLGSIVSDPAGKYLRMLTSNTRHWLNTSLFSMQRYTYLPASVRRNINTWFFGAGMSPADTEILERELGIRISEYIPKYSFQVKSPEFDVDSLIRV